MKQMVRTTTAGINAIVETEFPRRTTANASYGTSWFSALLFLS